MPGRKSLFLKEGFKRIIKRSGWLTADPEFLQFIRIGIYIEVAQNQNQSAVQAFNSVCQCFQHSDPLVAFAVLLPLRRKMKHKYMQRMVIKNKHSV